jgi:chemotaxis protein MotA
MARSRELATMFGLLSGLGLIVAAMALNGSPRAFFEPTAVLIVIGGTFSVTLISFSFAEIAEAFALASRSLLHARPDASDAARRALDLADRARRTGVASLKPVAERPGRSPFLGQAMGLVLDGLPAEEVERTLAREIEQAELRRRGSAGVFRKAAEVAPAMGLIGTLFGLVQMLGSLADPAAIGPGMAVALLTTFYGAVLANMVFQPLASKLEQAAEAHALVEHVYALAAGSILRQENPRRLELALNALLPPGRRVRVFD